MIENLPVNTTSGERPRSFTNFGGELRKLFGALALATLVESGCNTDEKPAPVPQAPVTTTVPKKAPDVVPNKIPSFGFEVHDPTPLPFYSKLAAVMSREEFTASTKKLGATITSNPELLRYEPAEDMAHNSIQLSKWAEKQLLPLLNGIDPRLTGIFSGVDSIEELVLNSNWILNSANFQLCAGQGKNGTTILDLYPIAQIKDIDVKDSEGFEVKGKMYVLGKALFSQGDIYLSSDQSLASALYDGRNVVLVSGPRHRQRKPTEEGEMRVITHEAVHMWLFQKLPSSGRADVPFTLKGKSVAFGPISEALDVEGVQDFHEAAAFAVTFMGNPNKAEFKGMMNDALNILQNKAPKGLLTSYHLNHKLFLMALLNSDFQSAHFRVLKDGFLKRKVIDKPSFDAFLEEISGEQIRALAQAVYETSYTVLQAQQNRVSPADQVSPFSPN